MTRPDREALRAWDRAVTSFDVALIHRVNPDRVDKSEHKPFWRTMADCQLAGFATPMEVARGGRR